MSGPRPPTAVFPTSACHRCVHNRYVRAKGDAVYLLCSARPEKYLPQPVRVCAVFVAAPPPEPGP